MSVILRRQTSYFFSSDSKTGASNIGNNGSTFSVALNSPIQIPKGSIDCEIGINSAAIWYVNPNVSLQLTNNAFRFTTSAAPAGTYTITFPDGLYSLDGLNATLSNAIVNLGLPANLFVLSGDDATQSTIITILTSGDSIDFTIANSLRTVLGFNSAVYTAPSANYNLYSPNPAAFNADNSYLISSDIVPDGIPINNQSFGVLVNVPITATPGSQILYAPSNIVWSDANSLIGQTKQFLNFRLTNQSLVPVNTVGETYQFTLVLRWSMLITDQKLPLKP